MSLWGRLQSVLDNSLNEEYIDLTAVVLLTVATVSVALLPVVRETALRPIIGLLFIILAPGWAVVAALFPGASRNIDFDDIPEELPFSGDELRELVAGGAKGDDKIETDSVDEHLGGLERLAISLGVGVAVVALAGLMLNYTPWPIALETILATLSGITLLCVLIGGVRRSILAPSERFSIPLSGLRSSFDGPWKKKDYVLNAALVVSVLLLIGTMGFTLTVPSPDDRYTNFWVVTEDDEGEFVAGDYSEALEANGERDLVIGIDNNENEEILYVVVVQLQEVERGTEEIVVNDRSEIDRFEEFVATDQQWTQRHEITPGSSNETVRIQYLFYKIEEPYTDTVPENPTAENADNDLHIWVTD